MASELADIDQRGACHELLGDKSVAKVIYLGVFDAGKLEVTVDAASDVSDEERIASFGNEDIFGSTFGPLLEVDFERSLGSTI